MYIHESMHNRTVVIVITFSILIKTEVIQQQVRVYTLIDINIFSLLGFCPVDCHSESSPAGFMQLIPKA